MLYNLFLQIEATGILQKVADQGLSLSLLGLAAKIFWDRSKVQDEKLTKYMEEDRKAMMDVITKNTEAFNKVNEHFDQLSNLK